MPALKKGTSRARIAKNVARQVGAGVPQDKATKRAVKYANQQARQGK